MQNTMGINNRPIAYDGKIAGLYDLEETLGSGHFAVVKLARHVFTGEKVAVKVIDKTKLDEVSRAHLFQEVRCMKLVQHPNVVRLYQVIDTQTKLYLILELGDGGDLYDYIMKHEGGLSEKLARDYFRQILRAISYCHQLHVVHRDLKPENVVFFEKLGVVKLTDFGFSNKFCPGQKLETSCGSLAYSAPEILLGDSYDAPAVDIWSLGVILYMLVCGQPPFEKANDSETLTMIMDCKYTMPPHVSEGCRNLISSMLVRAPEKRATLEKIAQNEWLIHGAGDSAFVPEHLPLVSRQQVSDDDHNIIIQKMCNGKIASKEEILEALDRDDYNHITATYFLLAEKKLRQKRQEQILLRRPELSLPVSASSRLSPRSRIQNIKDIQAAKDATTTGNLIVTTSNTLCPRTPGTETSKGGRTRKCSIVQEEDDDEDEIPTKRDDLLVPPLNRRGSRSEGRINLAIQSASPQNTIATKKDCTNITTINNSPIPSSSKNLEIKKIVNNNNNIDSSKLNKNGVFINNTVKRNIPPIEVFVENDNTHLNIETKILVDSSTITIPITSTTISETNAATIPKYKTMPSPTRPNVFQIGTRQLNEIFEEGTDIGSSDTSATTTPRPTLRSAHFTRNNLTTTPSGTHPHHHHHRRTKFHKSRTPSCSSSEASDDDSESRKKRAHKIPDLIKPLSQRRDSHDDSSDSQDQGAVANNNQNQTKLLTTTENTTKTNCNNQNSSNGKNSNDSSGTTSRQKTDLQDTPTKQTMQFRRRRRTGETTRLRESQSLNRITEVQESELPNLANHLPCSNSPICNEPLPNANLNQDQYDDEETYDTSVIADDPDSSISTATTTTTTTTTNTPTIPTISLPTTTTANKSKSFGARLFQGFIKNKNPSTDDNKLICQQTNESKYKDVDETDYVLGVEFAKQLRVNETQPTKTSTSSSSSSATKKLKMLGKYFQVHKKIGIPLSGLLFQRNSSNNNNNNNNANINKDIGRLYKAQSCGNVDRVNSNLLLVNNNKRHSVLLNDKNSKILLKQYLTQNHPSASENYLNSSDSDINQNQDKLLTSITTTNANTTKSIISSVISTSSTLLTTLKPTKISIQKQKNQLILNSSDILISTLDIKSTPSSQSTSNIVETLLPNNIISSSTSNDNLISHSPLVAKSQNLTINQQINDVPLCSSKC